MLTLALVRSSYVQAGSFLRWLLVTYTLSLETLLTNGSVKNNSYLVACSYPPIYSTPDLRVDDSDTRTLFMRARLHKPIAQKFNSFIFTVHYRFTKIIHDINNIQMHNLLVEKL